jgi:predicted oxidoreductase
VIETEPAVTFTFGGVRIDRDAHVVDAEGQAIPGLYAAGADAGGIYCRAYAGGIAAALVFGLRAAKSAAASASLVA